MPQIIRDSKQDLALEKISVGLEEIVRINAVITSGDCSFKLQSVGGAKAKFVIAPAQNDKVIALLKDRKKDLVKEVKAIAKANRIAFDEKEELAMSDAAYTKKQSETLEETLTKDDAEDFFSSEPGENDDLNLL